MQQVPKRFIHRYVQKLRVIINQKKILNLSTSNKFILLRPTPPQLCGGTIEHYYHFIFDLVMPLNALIRRLPSNTTFLLENFGVLTNRLEDLFPGRTHILNNSSVINNVKEISLLGMNPRCVHLQSRELEFFCFDVKHNLGIVHNPPRDQILLIERADSDPFYINSAIKKGSGAKRRSILNHADVHFVIQKSIKDTYQFANLQLEKISFRQQIDHFNKSIIVFAQHGAGLANCIWMKPGSIVIEFSNNASLDHFRTISRLKKHKYYLYKIQKEHTNIDTTDFLNWVLGHKELRSIFSAKDNFT